MFKYLVTTLVSSIMLTYRLILKESPIGPIGSWNVDIPNVLLSNNTSDPCQASKIIEKKKYIF